MSALDALLAVVAVAVLVVLLWRAAASPSAAELDERIAAAETWDELAGSAGAGVVISDRVATWTAGGRIRRRTLPVKDGLITIVADEQFLVLINRRARSGNRRTFVRDTTPSELVRRQTRVGGLVLEEPAGGARLMGWQVPGIADGLDALGWNVGEH
jgi:hypothetical protein